MSEERVAFVAETQRAVADLKALEGQFDRTARSVQQLGTQAGQLASQDRKLAQSAQELNERYRAQERELADLRRQYRQLEQTKQQVQRTSRALSDSMRGLGQAIHFLRPALLATVGGFVLLTKEIIENDKIAKKHAEDLRAAFAKFKQELSADFAPGVRAALAALNDGLRFVVRNWDAVRLSANAAMALILVAWAKFHQIMIDQAKVFFVFVLLQWQALVGVIERLPLPELVRDMFKAVGDVEVGTLGGLIAKVDEANHMIRLFAEGFGIKADEALARWRGGLLATVPALESAAKATKTLAELEAQIRRGRVGHEQVGIESITATETEGTAFIRDWAESVLGNVKELEGGVRQLTQSQRSYSDELGKSADRWFAIAQLVHGTIGMMGGALGAIGKLASTAGSIFAQFQEFKALQDSGQLSGFSGGIARAQYGASVGTQVGGLARDFGLIKGDRGTSQFGGKMSGDFGEEGALIGGIIGSFVGPIGTIVGALLGTLIGGLIKRGADEALTSFTASGGKLIFDAVKTEGGLEKAQSDLSNTITDGINALLSTFALDLESADFSFKIRDDTIRVFVAGVEKKFKDAQDAVDFAVTTLLKTAAKGGTIGGAGASEAMLTTLKNTNAQTIEQLIADLNFAKWYDRLGMSEFQASLDDMAISFDAAREKATELGLSTAKIYAEEARLLQDQRDKLLGIEKSEDQKRLEDIQKFNEHVVQLRAEAEADIAALLGQVAGEGGLSTQVAEELGEIARGLGLGADEAAAALERLSPALLDIARTTGAVTPEIQAQIDALRAFLGALPAPITPAEAAVPRPSGGGGSGRRQQLKEQLKTFASGILEPGPEDAVGRLTEDFERLKEEAQKLRLPIEELTERYEAALAILKEDELEAFREGLEQVREGWKDVVDPMRGFLSELRQLDKQLAEVEKEAERLGETIGDDVRKEFEAARQAILARHGRDLETGGVTMLADLLEQAGIEGERVAEMRFNLWLIEQKMRLAELQVRYELLQKEGLLIPGFDQVLAEIGVVIGGFEDGTYANPFAQAIADAGAGFQQAVQESTSTWLEQLTDINDLVKSMLDRYTSLTKSGGSRTVADEIDQLLAGFAEWAAELSDPANRVALRTSLAAYKQQFIDAGLLTLEEFNDIMADRTGEAAAEFFQQFLGEIQDLGIAALLKDIYQPLLDFGKDAGLGSSSPLTPQQRLNTAREQYEDLLARAAAGDMEAIRQLPGAAQRLLDEGQGYYGGASSQFAALFAEVTAAVQGLGESGMSTVEALLTTSDRNHEDLANIADILQQMLARSAQPTAPLEQRSARFGTSPRL